MIPAAVALGTAVLLLLLTPDALWAWGPPTHAYLGVRVLGQLEILPVLVRELLAAHPYQYLYGSLSADITFAKRYVHYSRHCHNWAVGYEILDRAETPALQSFALGYLSHLAADTIAHNVFVPRRLATSPLATGVGHPYWEYRFDTELGDEYLRLAREIVTMDHEEPDALLENVLTQAFFSFQTNKRIFRQIIHLSNRERWHDLWVRVADGSPWELPSEIVERNARLAEGYVIDLLRRGAASLSQRLDPIGHERLATAKKIRRRTLREARREVGRELATGGLAGLRLEDAARLATRPLPAGEMTILAEIYFPEPDLPPTPNGRGDGLASGDEAAFWGTFSGGRALPVGA